MEHVIGHELQPHPLQVESQNNHLPLLEKQKQQQYLKVKLNVHVFPESAGVVISVCPGVAEGLEDWVGLDQPVLDLVYLSNMPTALRHVLQHILGGLCTKK